MKLALWLGALLVALLLWLNIPDAVWRYVFYLRVPLLMGILLMGLPVLALTWLRAMLRNLFVLRGPWQMAFVIISAVMAGTSVMMVANIILRNAPARFEVPSWITLSEFWQYALAILLSLPVCITAIVLSKERMDISADTSIEHEKPRRQSRMMGMVTGLAISLGLLFGISQMRHWLDGSVPLNQFLVKFITLVTKQETQGYIDPQTGKLAAGHLTALAFWLIGFAIYGFIAWRFQPKPKAHRSEAPALLYVMVLLSGVTLLFGGMTFFFDFYRLLPIVLFLVASAVSYGLFRVDHFFKLKPLPQPQSAEVLSDFATVLDRRLAHQSGEKTLVLVCASGGGIQAAGWTVQVLTGLQTLLGDSFTQAIGLISSASGGSVGTMYFLDRFNLNRHAPDSRDLASIFESATSDSLDAVGWGLAYPDLWRLVGLPFLIPKLCDRGTAVETDWRGELYHPTASLASWRTQVLAGEIPIPVFNATLVEDGRRFLISPLTFVGSLSKQLPMSDIAADKFSDFNTLYGDYDISVVTAARLSATFPYISPICRNNLDLKGKDYHLADGGYFDNSGVFTVVEWLNSLLSANQIPDIKRIVLLQINAFPQSLPTAATKAGDVSRGGWAMALLGPLLALFRVRDSTQTARNETEIELLGQRWSKHGVEIQHFPISFPSFEEMQRIEKEFAPPMQRPYFFNRDGRYNPPLSWKLTHAEKKAIKRAWELIACDPTGQVQRLRQQWQKWQQNSQ
nr:MAG: patatin-like phospholipase family protein [Leptolyngbya sp. IPPAS B-1204]